MFCPQSDGHVSGRSMRVPPQKRSCGVRTPRLSAKANPIILELIAIGQISSGCLPAWGVCHRLERCEISSRKSSPGSHIGCTTVCGTYGRSDLGSNGETIAMALRMNAAASEATF